MAKRTNIMFRTMAIVCSSTLLLIIVLSALLLVISNRSQQSLAARAIAALGSERQNQETLLKQSFERKSQAIAEIMALNAANLIESFDFDSLELMAQSASADPEIKHVAIYGKDNKLLAGLECSTPSDDTYQNEIVNEDGTIGIIHIHRDNTIITSQMQVVSDRITEMVGEFNLLRQRSFHIMIASTVIIAASGLITICAVIYLLLKFKVVGPFKILINAVSDTSHEVGGVSHSVFDSSRSVAESASQQAASLEEASANLEEISLKTKNNSNNAFEARDHSLKVKQYADSGKETTAMMNNAVAEIQSSSEDIVNIIKVIDSIAFQTNLLALNAAVEAARAGEAGKGFAVVAEEVRNLAIRSTEAARSTSGMIDKAVASSTRVVEIASKVSQLLQDITDGVDHTAKLIDSIVADSQEQAHSLEQIHKAVSQIDQFTQNNATDAQKGVQSSEMLNSQTSHLDTIVADLSALV